MKADLFDRFERWEWDYPGPFDRRVKNPAFYQDGTLLAAVYTVNSSKVRRLLPTRKLKPVNLIPGRALAVVTALEVRASDLDPYCEVGVSFFVSYNRYTVPFFSAVRAGLARDYETFVWHLPVTTEIARYGGVHLVGLPKFIADIKFDRSESQVACRVSENGSHVLTLTGNVLRTRGSGETRVKVFSQKNGHMLASNMYTDVVEFGETYNRNAAKLEFGAAHPIGRALSDIDLSPRPLLYQYCPRIRMALFLPHNVEDN